MAQEENDGSKTEQGPGEEHALGVCFSGGRWVTSDTAGDAQSEPAAAATAVPNPFLERVDTLEAFSKSMVLEGASPTKLSTPGDGGVYLGKERNPSVWRMSGVAVGDLFQITTDPRVQKRIRKADTNNDGRISRRDILGVMQSEHSAKKKLKWGLIIGGALLLVCLLMLAANAALTYVVVNMTRETSVQSNGVLTDKAGSTVVGTAQAAELADLLYAYANPQDAGSALLGLRELLVTSDDGSLAAYQVLSSTLVPGQRLEFVVLASTGTTAGTAVSAAEFMRIVISQDGVHEVRSSAAGQAGGRRLLASPGSSTAGVKGLMPTLSATSCAPGSSTCSAAANQMSCPFTPTCGTNGQAYSGPCQAVQAGTEVKCTNCSACATGGRPLPGNLGWDGGNYLRSPPPSVPPPANPTVNSTSTGTLAGTTSRPPPSPPRKPAPLPKKKTIRRNQN